MTAEPKILLWDIESTSLNADFGTILCIGWKWLGKNKIHVADRDQFGSEPWDDGGLVQHFVETAYDKADYTVAHYGSRFDLPMVVTKCLFYDLPVPTPKPLVDTWWISRKNLKLHNNRLDSISKWLAQLDSKVDDLKTGILPEQWRRAMCGCRKSMKYVKDHCYQDIVVLENVFNKLRPLADNEPARHLFEPLVGGCISCGSPDLQKRGWRVAKTLRYQQYCCNTCGKWQRSRKADKQQGAYV